MTIAKGAIQKMKDIYELVPKEEVPSEVVDDLDNFFSVCIDLCVVTIIPFLKLCLNS